jgi:hypothetical protein
MTARPLAVDLYAGLGGWTSGLLAEGYDVIGFDIERHVYGEHRYPAQLVVQDVLTLHGSQFRNATLIVASPPCQFFSYTAMPWSRAKALAAKVRADAALLEKELALFNACFRIQAEACEAAGRHIPLVIENVRGAIPWVGRSRWNFGSYHLWGDVPALMPITLRASKVPGFRFDGSGRSFQSASVAEAGIKGAGPAWDSASGSGAHGMSRWTNPAEGRKHGGDWFRDPTCPSRQGGQLKPRDGRKGAGAGAEWFDQNLCRLPSASPRRKAASAMIAKIPEPLSRHIARTFFPRSVVEAA